MVGRVARAGLHWGLHLGCLPTQRSHPRNMDSSARAAAVTAMAQQTTPRPVCSRDMTARAARHLACLFHCHRNQDRSTSRAPSRRRGVLTNEERGRANGPSCSVWCCCYYNSRQQSRLMVARRRLPRRTPPHTSNFEYRTPC